jgi:8-oxo-dGTP pyrophosphatase MutT (NUDIX family)
MVFINMVSLLLIEKNKEFLLLKRSDNGLYGLPGGGVEENETPNDALIREVKEEMGVFIPNFKLLKKYPYNSSFLCVYYFKSSDFDENTIVLNNEHTEFNFFSYFEVLNLKNQIIPTTIRFINDYLNI